MNQKGKMTRQYLSFRSYRNFGCIFPTGDNALLDSGGTRMIEGSNCSIRAIDVGVLMGSIGRRPVARGLIYQSWLGIFCAFLETTAPANRP